MEYGDGTTHNGVDVTNYATVWGGPWPDKGINVRVTANKNNYIAEGFVVPTDGSVTQAITWGNTGSGNLSLASYAVSSCPGDFGQTGTKITDVDRLHGARVVKRLFRNGKRHSDTIHVYRRPRANLLPEYPFPGEFAEE